MYIHIYIYTYVTIPIFSLSTVPILAEAQLPPVKRWHICGPRAARASPDPSPGIHGLSPHFIVIHRDQ